MEKQFNFNTLKVHLVVIINFKTTLLCKIVKPCFLGKVSNQILVVKSKKAINAESAEDAESIEKITFHILLHRNVILCKQVFAIALILQKFFANLCVLCASALSFWLRPLAALSILCVLAALREL